MSWALDRSIIKEAFLVPTLLGTGIGAVSGAVSGADDKETESHKVVRRAARGGITGLGAQAGGLLGMTAGSALGATGGLLSGLGAEGGGAPIGTLGRNMGVGLIGGAGLGALAGTPLGAYLAYKLSGKWLGPPDKPTAARLGELAAQHEKEHKDKQ